MGSKLGRRRWPGNSATSILIVALLLAAIPSCLELPLTEPKPCLLRIDPSAKIQTGEVTLHDGEQEVVRFEFPFQSTPRVEVLTVTSSDWKKAPYKIGDFAIQQVGPTSFRICNNHPEANIYSWATIKWQSHGVPTLEQSAAAFGLFGPSQGDQNRRADYIAARLRKAEAKVAVEQVAQKNVITSIDVHSLKITDADLEVIEGMASIRGLNLYNTKISDAGLKHLQSLSELRNLNLNDTRVTDSGMHYLQGMKKLAVLGLSRTAITDEGLAALSGLTALTVLYLSGDAISDKGLSHLTKLTELRTLWLDHTKVTPEGAEGLRKSLPALKIIPFGKKTRTTASLDKKG